MTNRILYLSRNAYTIFDALGDFGGFNGSVFMIISFIVSAYSARMYWDQISMEIPLQTKNFRSTTKLEILKFKKKFSKIEDSPFID